MLLGNADAIVQHLCLRIGWDLPLDPRQKGALDQSARAHAILGKRPSSSTDLTNEPENVIGPTRVGDRYGFSMFLPNRSDPRFASATCGCLKVRMVEDG